MFASPFSYIVFSLLPPPFRRVVRVATSVLSSAVYGGVEGWSLVSTGIQGWNPRCIAANLALSGSMWLQSSVLPPIRNWRASFANYRQVHCAECSATLLFVPCFSGKRKSRGTRDCVAFTANVSVQCFASPSIRFSLIGFPFEGMLENVGSSEGSRALYIFFSSANVFSKGRRQRREGNLPVSCKTLLLKRFKKIRSFSIF